MSLDDLAQKLSGVVICADVCAVTTGIDLAAAAVAKLNATSGKVGLATRLANASHGRRTIADCPSDGRPMWAIGGHYAEPTLRAADGSYW